MNIVVFEAFRLIFAAADMEISTLALSSSFCTYPPLSLAFSSSSSSILNPNFIISTNLNRKKALVFNPVKRRGVSCTCLFGLGVPELVVIAGVAALLFGPKQLPEVGRSIGKTIKSFQQAAKEFETELKKEPDTITEPPPSRSPAASVSEVEKQDATVSSSKENSYD